MSLDILKRNILWLAVNATTRGAYTPREDVAETDTVHLTDDGFFEATVLSGQWLLKKLKFEIMGNRDDMSEGDWSCASIVFGASVRLAPIDPGAVVSTDYENIQLLNSQEYAVGQVHNGVTETDDGAILFQELGDGPTPIPDQSSLNSTLTGGITVSAPTALSTDDWPGTTPNPNRFAGQLDLSATPVLLDFGAGKNLCLHISSHVTDPGSALATSNNNLIYRVYDVELSQVV
jgi:hypothetical protein